MTFLGPFFSCYPPHLPILFLSLYGPSIVAVVFVCSTLKNVLVIRRKKIIKKKIPRSQIDNYDSYHLESISITIPLVPRCHHHPNPRLTVVISNVLPVVWNLWSHTKQRRKVWEPASSTRMYRWEFRLEKPNTWFQAQLHILSRELYRKLRHRIKTINKFFIPF